MIQIDVFRNLIKEGQEVIEGVELLKRRFDFEEHGRYVLVGIRQAGKSYLLYQRARMLMEEGHELSEIVYINFDDERLLGMTADDFDLILQAHATMYNCRPVFFFDEIQNVDGWEHFARRLANQKYMVYITGSNAKMLSRDIATTLGARYLDRMVMPYSFSEYLEAIGVELSDGWMWGKVRLEVQRCMAEYIKWGGFPELLLFKNKRHWLGSLYDKILLGDVVGRNGIKNEQALRLAVKRLAENVRQPIAYNRLANMVKSTGVSTNTASIMEYIKYLKESCLMFSLDNYASKFVERETTKKHYFMDNGLLSIFLIDGNTSLFENLCAITLYRQYGTEQDEPGVYYYHRGVEVDFYVPSECMAVQASYSIADDETRRRETSALVAFAKVEHLNRALIVTCDQEETIAMPNGLTIEVVPVWKWVLGVK